MAAVAAATAAAATAAPTAAQMCNHVFLRMRVAQSVACESVPSSKLVSMCLAGTEMPLVVELRLRRAEVLIGLLAEGHPEPTTRTAPLLPAPLATPLMPPYHPPPLFPMPTRPVPRPPAPLATQLLWENLHRALADMEAIVAALDATSDLTRF